MDHTIVTDLSKLLEKTEYLVNIEEKKDEILAAFEIMRTFIDQNPTGVGLAANQISINLPIILVKLNGNYNFYVNPIYGPDYLTKQHLSTEGCLNFPGFTCAVPRFKKIIISGFKYSDDMFKPLDETKTGHFAAVFQHEVDHLHGITMLQKAVQLVPKENSKRVYSLEDKNDFIIEGSSVNIFNKIPIEPSEIEKHYIVAYYDEDKNK